MVVMDKNGELDAKNDEQRNDEMLPYEEYELKKGESGASSSSSSSERIEAENAKVMADDGTGNDR